jgi:hypothetical protein
MRLIGKSSDSKAAEGVNRDGFALSPIRAVVSDGIVRDVETKQ